MDRTIRLLAVTLVVATLAACSSQADAPVVADVWARSNPNGMGAAYLTITLPTDDLLVGATVDAAVAARVEVHEVVDDAGRMLMRRIDGGIPLPGGSAIELRPGGYHLMLLDMPAMLPVGSTFLLTLEFATAPSLTVSVEVREGAATGMDGHGMDQGSMPHGTMDHGTSGPGSRPGVSGSHGG
jgi:periplasmic copper chaperone A